MKDTRPKIMLDADFFTNRKFRGLAHSIGEKACYKLLILFGLMRSAGGKLDSQTPGFWPWLAKEIDVSVKVVEGFMRSLCRKEFCEDGVYEFLDFDGRYYWAQQQLEDIEAFRRKCERMSDLGKLGAAAKHGSSVRHTDGTADGTAFCIANGITNGVQIYLLSLSSLKILKKEWDQKLASRPAEERERVWQLAKENGHECVIHYLRIAELYIQKKQIEGADVVATALTFLLRDKPTKSGFFAGGVAPSKAAMRPERRIISGGSNA